MSAIRRMGLSAALPSLEVQPPPFICVSVRGLCPICRRLRVLDERPPLATSPGRVYTHRKSAALSRRTPIADHSRRDLIARSAFRPSCLAR